MGGSGACSHTGRGRCGDRRCAGAVSPGRYPGRASGAEGQQTPPELRPPPRVATCSPSHSPAKSISAARDPSRTRATRAARASCSPPPEQGRDSPSGPVTRQEPWIGLQGRRCYVRTAAGSSRLFGRRVMGQFRAVTRTRAGRSSFASRYSKEKLPGRNLVRLGAAVLNGT